MRAGAEPEKQVTPQIRSLLRATTSNSQQHVATCLCRPLHYCCCRGQSRRIVGCCPQLSHQCPTELRCQGDTAVRLALVVVAPWRAGSDGEPGGRVAKAGEETTAVLGDRSGALSDRRRGNPPTGSSVGDSASPILCDLRCTPLVRAVYCARRSFSKCTTSRPIRTETRKVLHSTITSRSRAVGGDRESLEWICRGQCL